MSAVNTDTPWVVYATCRQCKGIVAVSTFQASQAPEARKAQAEAYRVAGFNAFPVRQTKMFTVGDGLKTSCPNPHVVAESSHS